MYVEYQRERYDAHHGSGSFDCCLREMGDELAREARSRASEIRLGAEKIQAELVQLEPEVMTSVSALGDSLGRLFCSLYGAQHRLAVPPLIGVICAGEFVHERFGGCPGDAMQEVERLVDRSRMPLAGGGI